jgi:1,4-alpha-glucan branching enzyme
LITDREEDVETGSIALVLNAHLPFVRQPDYSSFLEERWLFEALSETYLPLLRLFARLEAEKVPWKITMAVSPTLSAMLGDQLLKDRYIIWLEKQLELAGKELERCSGDPVFYPLAQIYYDLYLQDLDDFKVLHGGNVLAVLDYYYKKGRLELMTSGATQSFMPMYRAYPESIAAQIENAVVSFRSTFGRSPSGFWMPQLGWYPGVEKVLSAYGLQYTIVTTRSALLGNPTPRTGSYAPLACPNGFMTYIRDVAATEAVWSETDGYPADPAYRDFYRDIGFDLPVDYVGPYIDQNQVRTYTGFKYWAITGHTDQKVPYDPDMASAKAVEHAENFLYSRARQARKAAALMDRPALMVAPYDAELFGHSWFEGLQWLEALFRKAQGTSELRFVSLGEYRKEYPEAQKSVPEFSSWGDGGYAAAWLEKSNSWIYRHSFKMAERMVELAERFPNESGLRERVLNQAAREVLLVQASDWPFLLRAGKSGSFARKQIEDAVTNFCRIYEMLCANTVGTEWLTRLEKRNNIFPNINYRVFRRKR